MPTGTPNPESQIVYVAFALHGRGVPVDHGCALCATLSRLPKAGTT